jgi:hypothetical protein
VRELKIMGFVNMSRTIRFSETINHEVNFLMRIQFLPIDNWLIIMTEKNKLVSGSLLRECRQ